MLVCGIPIRRHPHANSTGRGIYSEGVSAIQSRGLRRTFSESLRHTVGGIA